MGQNGMFRTIMREVLKRHLALWYQEQVMRICNRWGYFRFVKRTPLIKRLVQEREVIRAEKKTLCRSVREKKVLKKHRPRKF